MLIRTQDRLGIVNLNLIDELFVREINPEKYGVHFENKRGEFEPIGSYSTVEQAIKVLDMIEEEYSKHLHTNGGMLTTTAAYAPPFAYTPPKVFQMPADDKPEPKKPTNFDRITESPDKLVKSLNCKNCWECMIFKICGNKEYDGLSGCEGRVLKYLKSEAEVEE